MADTQAETTTQPQAIPAASTSEEAQGTYPMSREGRRQAIVLLLGVLSIWVFALWTLITTLEGGITGVEWVSGLLMLGILLVAPLVAWTFLEEANSRITADDQGITYSTFGEVRLVAPWTEVTGFKPRGEKGKLARFFLGDGESKSTVTSEDVPAQTQAAAAAAPFASADGEDNETTGEEETDTAMLAVRSDPTLQISNPVVRFLHRQSYGDAIPVHGGLEHRRALIEEITSHIQ
jgi:hypothetical protein